MRHYETDQRTIGHALADKAARTGGRRTPGWLKAARTGGRRMPGWLKAARTGGRRMPGWLV